MADSVYAIVAKVFSMSENDINDESGPENIESWDSFNGLILVDELENNFNIKFLEINKQIEAKKCPRPWVFFASHFWCVFWCNFLFVF